MASIFTKIIRGDIPSYKLAEDDKFFAFLDINPLARGHALVVPKQETDYIFDLDDKLLADLMVFARKVAKGIEAVVPCERMGMTVIGLEVPHAHVHLIPIRSIFDMNFERPKLKFSPDEFSTLASEISDMITASDPDSA